MPTQATFLAAADAFEAAAHDVSLVLPPLDALVTPPVLDGGLLTRQVTTALVSCTSALAVVVQACRDAAAESRWRAEVCAVYGRHVAAWGVAMTDYQHATRRWQASYEEHQASPNSPDPGPPPRSPGPTPPTPFTWVD